MEKPTLDTILANEEHVEAIIREITYNIEMVAANTISSALQFMRTKDNKVIDIIETEQDAIKLHRIKRSCINLIREIDLKSAIAHSADDA